MHLSLSTMIFHSSFGELREEHLAWLAEQGFRCVEITGEQNHFPWSDAGRVRQLAGWFAKHSIRPLTFHLPFRTRMQSPDFHYLSLSEPYEPWRREALAAKIAMAKLAADLGCRLVIEHGPGDEYDGPNGDGSVAPLDLYRKFTLDEARALYRRTFAEFWESVAPLGLSVAVENVMSRGSTMAELVDFCRVFHDERIGICLDLGHANVSGDPMEYARTGSDYLLALHVHDNEGEIDEHHPPFSGTIDWSAVLPVLAAAPRLVAFTLELVYAGGPVTEAGVRGQLSDIAAISKRLKQGLAGSIE